MGEPGSASCSSSGLPDIVPKAVGHPGKVGHTPRPAPVHSLPPETLDRIFGMACESYFCVGHCTLGGEVGFNSLEPPHSSLKYPELLSHVCSRWRQMLVDSPRYWTRIDVIPYHKFSETLLDRAETFITRARHLPLNIHILNISLIHSYNPIRFSNFLSLSMPRANSLNIVVRRAYSHFFLPLIESCFRKASPARLCQLSMTGIATTGEWAVQANFNAFLEPAGNYYDAHSLFLRIPRGTLEEIWRPITVLRTNDLCPHWSSCAYSGLVELRLTPKSPVQISKFWLIKILESSPELRILQLNVSIAVPVEEIDMKTGVRLEQLEVLDLDVSTKLKLEVVLPIIYPGDKPLELTVHLPVWCDDSQIQTHVRNFFARSNVTRIRMVHLGRYSWVTEILVHVPLLDRLKIVQSNLTDGLLPVSRSNGRTHESSYRLEVCIERSELDLDYIRRILQLYPVGRLTLRGTKVGPRESAQTHVADQELRDQLSLTCSDIRLLTETGVPDDTPHREFWH